MTDFGKTLQDFYTELLINQEPLGEEFEKVLNDNYWDLLVTDSMKTVIKELEDCKVHIQEMHDKETSQDCLG